MEDLNGVAKFTEEEISAMDSALSVAGIQMPQFGKIGGILAGEIGEDAAAVHAAVLAINDCLKREAPTDELFELLSSLAAGLQNLSGEQNDMYRTELMDARAAKAGQASGPVSRVDSQDNPMSPDFTESDVYDYNLTKDEIQKGVNVVNATAAKNAKEAELAAALAAVQAAVTEKDAAALITALKNYNLELAEVREHLAAKYLEMLVVLVAEGGDWNIATLQDCIDDTHSTVEKAAAAEAAIKAINQALEDKSADDLHDALTDEASGVEGVRPGLGSEYLASLLPIYGDGIVELEVDDIQAGINDAHAFIAAVVAINDAIEGEDEDELLVTLQSAAAKLDAVDAKGKDDYLKVLYDKIEGDALEHAEIQEAIKEANESVYQREVLEAGVVAHADAIKAINDAILTFDEQALLSKLQDSNAKITGINVKASMEYLAVLMEHKEGKDSLTKDEIQGGVAEANHIIEEQQRAEDAVAELNRMLMDDDEKLTFKKLNQFKELLELPALLDSAARRYHDRLVVDARERGRLTQNGIVKCLKAENGLLENERIFADAITAVNDGARAGEGPAVLAALQHESLQLADVVPEIKSELCDFVVNCGERYQVALLAAITETGANLDRTGIEAAVTSTNTAIEQERITAEAVEAVNSALEGIEEVDTLAALQHENLLLTGIDDAGAEQYHAVMVEKREETEAKLTRNQMQECVDHTNYVAEENAKHASALFALNEAVRRKDSTLCLTCLQEPYTKVEEVLEKCKDRYLTGLTDAQETKEQTVGKSLKAWKRFSSDDGRPYYYNKESKETQWVPPVDAQETMLAPEELQAVIARANADQERQEFFEANESSVTLVQSRVRGFLVRKEFQERMSYLGGQKPTITWLQSMCRMLLQRTRYRNRLGFLNAQEDATLRIQAAWKGTKVRRNYKGLVKVVNPPVGTVRRFLHLLDQSEIDFSEELAVNKLKAKVVTEIKRNGTLESSVNEMDIKIGLLVKNRIELQDVVERNKALKKQQTRRGNSKPDLMSSQQGLKSLDKKNRERLQSYEHMFYLLQTNPDYFATLVFVDKPFDKWTRAKAQKFLEEIILSTYNYGSRAREQYLLLKLFRVALAKEIKLNMDDPKQFLRSDPYVVKLMVKHYRERGSNGYFTKVLVPLIAPLIRTDLNININPVDVYKQWVNETEVQTGEKSSLPYEVEAAEAMKHKYVVDKINAAFQELFRLVAEFQTALIESYASIPFGLKCLSMCVKENMKEKFPGISEDALLKLVGDLVCRQFFNNGLINPDGNGIVTGRDVELLSKNHRTNLAIIAKFLQLAATGADNGNAQHKAFFAQSWAKFRGFFERVSDVESAEAHYSIDEYSDVTMLSRPTIYVSQFDIYHTHLMLTENKDAVMPEASDPLNEVLSDLGELASDTVVLGTEDSEQFAKNKAEISLTLTNKFEVPEESDQSVKALFVRTKRYVVDVIRYQQGKNLKQILSTPATDEMEEQHRLRAFDMQAKEKELQSITSGTVGTNAEKEKAKMKRRLSKKHMSVNGLDLIMTLEAVKAKIIESALELEKHGLCSSSNNFQDLLNSVANDIRNQRVYRRQRKGELKKLELTLTDLGKKRSHMDDQIEQWGHYLQSCMQRITEKKTKKKGLFGGKSKSKAPVGEDGKPLYHVGGSNAFVLVSPESAYIVRIVRVFCSVFNS